MADVVAGLDAGFLLTETSTMPWHVLGVLVLDPSTAPAPFDVATVRALVAARLDGIEAFRKTVVQGRFDVWPRWSEGDVDIDAHVVAADLPPDSTMADVEAFVGRLAATPLDRSRPLWELHVVERFDDGLAAVVAKVHHALADGITAVGVIAALLDLEPLPAGPPTIDLAPPPAPASPGLRDAPVIATRAVWHAGRAAVMAAQRGISAGRHSFGFMSARTSGNAPLTSRRQVATATLPVDTVLAMKAAYAVTFNDIVLAAIAGALRSWLDDDDQLPSASMLAAVPVSIRAGDSGALPSRNQVSVIFVALPVHEPDPAERVRLVGHDTKRSKRLHEAAGSTTLGDLAAIAPWPALGALWRVAWWTGAAKLLPPPANLVVSSVPGPTMPLYMAGARLTGLYPIGPIMHGVPLNVTAVSRDRNVEIGVITCPDVCPDVTNLGDRMNQALADIVAAAPTP